LLPAAFAKQFEGEPFALAQNFAREFKLMDACFHASVAPYIRTFPLNGFDVNADATALNKSMVAAKGLQKFVHVVLQRCCIQNSASQAYFGARFGPAIGACGVTSAAPLLSGKQGPPPHGRWMDALTAQLEDPLGSAVTLSLLLSSSAPLMSTYANVAFVNKFVDMIDRLGPQPRLIQFFVSLCVVGGKPVKANQELVLREVWLNPKKRWVTMLQVQAVPRSEMPVPPYPPVFSATTGDPLSSRFSADEMRRFPPEFVAQHDVGLPPLKDRPQFDSFGAHGELSNDAEEKEDDAFNHALGDALLPPGEAKQAAARAAMAKKAAVLGQRSPPPDKWAGVDLDAEAVGSFAPVYVKWLGSSDWKKRSSLFFAPHGVPDADLSMQRIGPDAGAAAVGAALGSAAGAASAAGLGTLGGVLGSKKEKEKAVKDAKKAKKDKVEKIAAVADDDGGGGEPPEEVVDPKSQSDYAETIGWPPIPSHEYREEYLVRIEALSWVLAPGDLCQAVTGMAWADAEAGMVQDPYKKVAVPGSGAWLFKGLLCDAIPSSCSSAETLL
jgi:hypothetical protein